MQEDLNILVQTAVENPEIDREVLVQNFCNQYRLGTKNEITDITEQVVRDIMEEENVVELIKARANGWASGYKAGLRSFREGYDVTWASIIGNILLFCGVFIIIVYIGGYISSDPSLTTTTYIITSSIIEVALITIGWALLIVDMILNHRRLKGK